MLLYNPLRFQACSPMPFFASSNNNLLLQGFHRYCDCSNINHGTSLGRATSGYQGKFYILAAHVSLSLIFFKERESVHVSVRTAEWKFKVNLSIFSLFSHYNLERPPPTPKTNFTIAQLWLNHRLKSSTALQRTMICLYIQEYDWVALLQNSSWKLRSWEIIDHNRWAAVQWSGTRLI